MEEINQSLYTKNFWQNYKVIYQHFLKKQKEIMDIFYIFNKISSLLIEFLNGLNNLSQYPFNFDSNSTFGNAMQIFVNSIKETYNIILKFHKEIKNIMLKINDRLSTTIHTTKDQIIMRSKAMNEFINFINDNENKKKDYHLKVREVLQKKLKFEDNNNKGKEDLKKLIDKAKESREIYKNSLIEVNEKRKEYINAISICLLTFENKESSVINDTKQNIIQYSNLKIKIFEEIINLIKKNLEENFNNINAELDISDFVNKNSSLGSQPFEIPFIEYSPDFQIQENDIQEKKKQTLIMKNFLQENFSGLDEKDEEIIEIQIICDKIWNNTFNDEEIEKLIFSFSENGKGEKMNKKNCLYFLNYYNKKRTTGKFIIENKSFEILIKCINYILNLNNPDLNKDKKNLRICDFEICGLCIILSQTYYRENPEKEYLQNGIEKNEIFQKKEFWFDLASYYIQSNYHEQMKNAISCIEELDEEDTMKIKSVAFGKISTILYNMKSFSVDFKLVKELSFKLCKQFNIEKEVINQIWSFDNNNNDENYLIFNDDNDNNENELNNNNGFDFEKEIKEAENIINDNKENENEINTEKK